VTYSTFSAVNAGDVLWIGASFKMVGTQNYPVVFYAIPTSLTVAGVDRTSSGMNIVFFFFFVGCFFLKSCFLLFCFQLLFLT
jgi:hypothetical protein